MSEFRSASEMADVYQQRANIGLSDQPYVLEYDHGGRRVIFFGARHSKDPRDKQWPELEGSWQRFIHSPNRHKRAFCEGGLRPVDKKTLGQAIIHYGETGLVCWLAEKTQVPVDSPEPGRAEEIDHLFSQGHPYGEIMNYYFARQMLQWVDADRKTQPDWQAYAKDLLNKYGTVHNWGKIDHSLDKVLGRYKDFTGEEFSIENSRQKLYELSDPSQNKVSSDSGEYRDQKLFEAIRDNYQSGYDVFVVYGSGHAIRLEPALEELMAPHRS